jgi:ABC-type multidrug transport system ATPase subunit
MSGIDAGRPDEVLVIRALRHCYGEVQAITRVDIKVHAGETVALLGPNGAGKSTLLAAVLGLLHPSPGKVTVLFATHYLAEAEKVAERVVLMQRGRVVADGPTGEMRRTVVTKHVRFRANGVDPARLARLPAVTRIEGDDQTVTLETANADETVGGLYRSGIVFSNLEVVGAGLEEAFMELTASELRP